MTVEQVGAQDLWCALVHSINGEIVYDIPKQSKEYFVVRTSERIVYLYCPIQQSPHYHFLHTGNKEPYNRYIRALGNLAFLETPIDAKVHELKPMPIVQCIKRNVKMDQQVHVVLTHLDRVCLMYHQNPHAVIAIKEI